MVVAGPVGEAVVGFVTSPADEMSCAVEAAVAETNYGAETLVPLDLVQMSFAVEAAAIEDCLSVAAMGALDIVAEVAVDRSAAQEPWAPEYEVERVYSGRKQNEVASSQSTGRGFA